MLFLTCFVALVVDAAVVPSETSYSVIYTATFTSKFDKNGQLIIDNLNKDYTVTLFDQKRLGQEQKTDPQFNIDQILLQKPSAKASWRDARKTGEKTKDVKVPQQQDRAEGKIESRQNAKDRETRFQVEVVNDPGLYRDQGVKDGVASASSSQPLTETTRKPDSTKSMPLYDFKEYFGSKSRQSKAKSGRDEATNRQGSQPGNSGTDTKTKNTQISENVHRFYHESAITAGLVSNTTNQDIKRSDSNSKFDLNQEDIKSEMRNNQKTSTEMGNYQRFDYTNPGNTDHYNTRKKIEDDNRKTYSNRFHANIERTEPGNTRTQDNGGTQKDDSRSTSTTVDLNGENDGKIYFPPDLEIRKITTTPTDVQLDNRNAFDVNVTCEPGTEKTLGGVCAPTE